MGAAPTHLHQLDRVQRRALHLMGPGVQSLAARRDVYALTFPYKLMYREEPLQLLTILVYPVTRIQLWIHALGHSTIMHQSHEYQLCQELAPNAPFPKRSFPHGIISTWNSQPRSSSLRYQRLSRSSHSRGMYIATCDGATGYRQQIPCE